MNDKIAKWDTSELSHAMSNAILSRAGNRFIKRDGHTIKFNGFWRNGDKQNICAWLDKATWHDAKTGEGGGCKDFARVAFSLSLPEFMEQYGVQSYRRTLAPKPRGAEEANSNSSVEVDKIWQHLRERKPNQTDYAERWLIDVRYFHEPYRFIGSGFANLDQEHVNLFTGRHRDLVQQRIKSGKNIVVPLRGVSNDKVENLFLRNIEAATKEDKSRLLTGCGGWSSTDGSPRAFGFPHLIHEFPNLVLCEGMADYFAAECLLDADEKYLPIGAPGTSAMDKWGAWLSQTKYNGRVHIVYQLDLDQNGSLNSYGPGQMAAVNTKRILSSSGLSVHLFDWSSFCERISLWHKAPGDLADVFVCSNTQQDNLNEAFLNTLKQADLT